ncbi:hypothetical protein DFJ67_7314 [Asanoa ferruginea]|uniref:Uncharacterized protein n=1 Tax=Asanoa ferruginea TaxID=53367 RepID=A0A3D9ZYK0_9ACTN|nr:hypothetical protein DFJ67_7314 [Asanoa ferruginea]
MRQLQFFTTTELAAMRDRTASRSYSPAGEEFRREHERHRAWGLTRRHAERLRRLRGSDCEPHTPTAAGINPERQPLTPPGPAVALRLEAPDRAVRPTADLASPASQNPGVKDAADRPGRQRNSSTETAAIASSRPAGGAPLRRAEKMPSRPAQNAPWRPMGNAPDAPIGTHANLLSAKRAAASSGKCDVIHNGNLAWRPAGNGARLQQKYTFAPRGAAHRDPAENTPPRPCGMCLVAARRELDLRGLAGGASSRPDGEWVFVVRRATSAGPARRRVGLRGPPGNVGRSGSTASGSSWSAGQRRQVRLDGEWVFVVRRATSAGPARRRVGLRGPPGDVGQGRPDGEWVFVVAVGQRRAGPARRRVGLRGPLSGRAGPTASGSSRSAGRRRAGPVRRRVGLRGPPGNVGQGRPGSDRPRSSARAELCGDGPAFVDDQTRQTQAGARGQSSISGGRGGLLVAGAVRRQLPTFPQRPQRAASGP